jgi:splicing factor 3A subunit 1
VYRADFSGTTTGIAPGPQIGPGLTSTPIQLPPALAASLPKPGGTAYAGATISAAPTGPSTREYISAPYNPAPVAPTAPSIHPSRLAQMGDAPPPPLIGQTRPASDDIEKERPVFKRPKVEKLPYGQLYSVRLPPFLPLILLLLPRLMRVFFL